MNSADYWQEREELHIKEMMEKDVQDSKDISRMYARAYRDIQRDINDFYVRYANENDMSLTEARRAVSKFDVEAFRDKAAQYVRDKDFSDQANEELRLYNLTMRVNRLELLKSEIGLECAALGNDIDKMFMQTLTEEAKAEALRQSGILGETLETLDVKQIDKIVRGSWQVNMQTQPTFSEAIWGHNEALKSRIDTMLTQSIIAGKHPREMASELMKIFDSSRYEAERLLRTESARVQGDIQMANFEQYGFEWYNIVREPTACKICIEAAANGPYKVLDKMIGLTMYPFHPNCRCSATPARVDNSLKNGNMEAERGMANGQRTSRLHILTEEEAMFVQREAMAIKIPKGMLRINHGCQTGYMESSNKIHIRGDVLPDETSIIARDRMSVRAVLAHEYYGHAANRPSEYEPGDWRDEFRASYDAALNAPNLSQLDRAYLMIDAYDRAKEAGQPMEYSNEAKRLIYGDWL